MLEEREIRNLPPPPHVALWEGQVKILKEQFPSSIDSVEMPPQAPTDMATLVVKKEAIIDVLTFLKTVLHYDFLADMTATDEETAPRFLVVYHLYSLKFKARIRIKIKVEEGSDVPTLSNVWKGADWQEREIYDMFGIKFLGHPNLRRILMDYRWQGHPLRKDYPLDGYQVFPDAEAPDPKRLGIEKGTFES